MATWSGGGEQQDLGFELRLPDELEPRAYIARHPPDIQSYTWRILRRGFGWLPAPEESPARARQRLDLAEHCLRRAHGELGALGLDHFVWLFHSPLSFAPLGPVHEDEASLRTFLEDECISYVDSRAVLEEEVRAAGLGIEVLHIDGPGNVWHPNERGTEVLFRSLQQGLERMR